MAFVQTHLPCPRDECNSSDAYAIDDKGNGYCFSCKTKIWNDGKEEDLSDELKMDYLEVRGIHPAILKKYNTFVSVLDGEPQEMHTPYPSGGTKIRNLKKKDFRTQGNMSDPMLFGKDIFAKGSHNSITITEGELDAMSVFQMVKGQSACVSVRNGAVAYADCKYKENWEYINSFDKIIICFDNDEVGQRNSKQVAGLFDFKKVYQVNMTKYKDPNGYLTATEEDKRTFYKEWMTAKRYTPDAILSSFQEIKEALEEEKGEKLCDWPVQKLNEKIKAIYAGDVIVIKGQEGLGKTEMLRLVENHILKTTNLSQAIIHLEENIDTTIQGVVSYHRQQMVDISEGISSKEEVLQGYMDAVDGNEDRIMLYNSFDMGEEQLFYDNIRFVVTVGGCKIVLFDHISWLATGGDGEDERKKLDRIAQRMKAMARELGFALIMVSHVNDEGQTRGSRNITKVADVVINLHRNKTDPDPEERNKMYLMIEKSRKRGTESGQAGFLSYDPTITNLVDVQAEKVV